MDIAERLSLEAASRPTVETCEHVHRYEVAASLCSGLRALDLACGSGYGSAILAAQAAHVHGVDRDAATIDLAAATFSAVTFQTADAHAYLEGDLAEEYDAIVCFEGLEHLSELDRALEHLRRHSDGGVRLILSVPNSATFEEQNPHHVTDFDRDLALELLERLGGGVMLEQFLSEGSLIGRPGDDSLEARLRSLERAEPGYANHFLLFTNVSADTVASAVGARRVLVEAPLHNRYVRGLEIANRELRRRNSELARTLMQSRATAVAKVGSAGASHIASLTKRIAELEAELADRPNEARRQEEMILAQRSELLQLRQMLVRDQAGLPN